MNNIKRFSGFASLIGAATLFGCWSYFNETPHPQSTQSNQVVPEARPQVDSYIGNLAHDSFDLPHEDKPILNPFDDGKSWVKVVREDGAENLWIANQEDPKGHSITFFRGSSSIQPRGWQDPTHVLFQAIGFGGIPAIYKTDVTRNQQPRFLSPPGSPSSLLAYNTKEILIETTVNGSNSIYRIPIDSNSALSPREPEVANPGDVVKYYVNHRLEVAAAVAYREDGIHLLARTSSESPWRTILKRAYTDVPFDPEFKDILGFSKDNKELYLLLNTNNSNQTVGVASINIETRKITVIPGASDPKGQYDVKEVLFDPETDKLLAFSLFSPDNTWISLDNSITQHLAKLTKPNEIFSIPQWFGKKWGVSSSGFQKPDYFAVYDRDTKQSRQILSTSNLKNDQLANAANTRVVQIPTKHGFHMDVFITSPKNNTSQSQEKKPRILVFVHGGPWDADQGNYHRPDNYFAQLGFVVVRAEPRSSTGRGLRYLNQANPDQDTWQAMADDNRAALDYVAQLGIADPSNTVFVGYSAGVFVAGHAAEWKSDKYQVTQTVLIAGPTNMREYVAYKSSSLLFRPFIEAHIGKPSDPLMDRLSPHVEDLNMNVQFLALHGDGDSSVPLKQSQQMIDDLNRLGNKNATLMKVPGGHGGLLTPEVFRRIGEFITSPTLTPPQ